MKWYWFGTIAVLLYIIYGWFKSAKQMMRLQRVAQAYPVEFRLFAEKEEGWEVFDMNHNGKGCIKLIPDPHVTTHYYYYIKFTGPISEKDAIDYLIKDFREYAKTRGI